MKAIIKIGNSYSIRYKNGSSVSIPITSNAYKNKFKAIIEKNNDLIVDEYSQEELAQQQIRQFEDWVDEYIQNQVNIYNKETGTLFKNIDAIGKWANITKSKHHEWVTKVLDWQSDVWGKCRELLEEFSTGNLETPSEKPKEEFYNLLPKFKGE